jgi:hypothetical protein
MEAGVRSAPRNRGLRAVDRLVAWFLLLLMAVGSLVLWIGVPAGCMYASGQWTNTAAEHFVVALPLTLAGMLLFGWLLFWINGIYMRVTGVIQASSEVEDDDEEESRHPRGPLELFLIVSLVIAIIALFAWFFLLAENPSPQVI